MTNEEIKNYIDHLNFTHLLKPRLKLETFIKDWGDDHTLSVTLRFRFTNKPPHRETILSMALPNQFFSQLSTEATKRRIDSLIQSGLRSLLTETITQCWRAND